MENNQSKQPQIKKQIENLKKELPDLEKTILKGQYSKEDIGTIEYFISRVISLAETDQAFQNSSQIRKMENLQTNGNYFSDTWKAYYINIVFNTAKGLLDTLDIMVA